MSDIPDSSTWVASLYQSGTQVVQRLGGGPHFHIGHLAADTEGDGGRSDVRRELTTWLNGGEEPWWMDLLNRPAPDIARTPHGCDIRATGPMVDMAEPPSFGLWREDDSADARITRGLMIDALINRDLTLLPKC